MPLPRLSALLTCGLLVAQAPSARAQAFPAPAPADEQAMRAALADSREGFNQGDLARHVAFYVDSVTFMTPTGPRPGKQRVVESFATSYFRDGKPIQMLSFDHVTVRALGADHALMTGNFHLTGGNRPSQQGWFTLVWERTAAGWKVLHDHSS
jgi:ketosteroid isomerase-like protein